MYYIYFMRMGKKCPLDNGKYYNTAEEAVQRVRKLSKSYRSRCLIEKISGF